jgi:hypothetical protein
MQCEMPIHIVGSFVTATKCLLRCKLYFVGNGMEVALN